MIDHLATSRRIFSLSHSRLRRPAASGVDRSQWWIHRAQEVAFVAILLLCAM